VNRTFLHRWCSLKEVWWFHGRECAFGVGRTSQVCYHALEQATHSWNIVLELRVAYILCLHDFEQCSKQEQHEFAWS